MSNNKSKKGKKQEVDQSQVEEYVLQVQLIVGDNISAAEIRKELALQNYSINNTATAFLDNNIKTEKVWEPVKTKKKEKQKTKEQGETQKPSWGEMSERSDSKKAEERKNNSNNNAKKGNRVNGELSGNKKEFQRNTGNARNATQKKGRDEQEKSGDGAKNKPRPVNNSGAVNNKPLSKSHQQQQQKPRPKTASKTNAWTDSGRSELIKLPPGAQLPKPEPPVTQPSTVPQPNTNTALVVVESKKGKNKKHTKGQNAVVAVNSNVAPAKESAEVDSQIDDGSAAVGVVFLPGLQTGTPELDYFKLAPQGAGRRRAQQQRDSKKDEGEQPQQAQVAQSQSQSDDQQSQMTQAEAMAAAASAAGAVPMNIGPMGSYAMPFGMMPQQYAPLVPNSGGFPQDVASQYYGQQINPQAASSQSSQTSQQSGEVAQPQGYPIPMGGQFGYPAPYYQYPQYSPQFNMSQFYGGMPQSSQKKFAPQMVYPQGYPTPNYPAGGSGGGSSNAASEGSSASSGSNSSGQASQQQQQLQQQQQQQQYYPHYMMQDYQRQYQQQQEAAGGYPMYSLINPSAGQGVAPAGNTRGAQSSSEKKPTPPNSNQGQQQQQPLSGSFYPFGAGFGHQQMYSHQMYGVQPPNNQTE